MNVVRKQIMMSRMNTMSTMTVKMWYCWVLKAMGSKDRSSGIEKLLKTTHKIIKISHRYLYFSVHEIKHLWNIDCWFGFVDLSITDCVSCDFIVPYLEIVGEGTVSWFDFRNVGVGAPFKKLLVFISDDCPRMFIVSSFYCSKSCSSSKLLFNYRGAIFGWLWDALRTRLYWNSP